MVTSLRRSLNLPQLIFYGVGTMVGAGIYSVIGAAAGEAGKNLWISFLFAAVAAFLTVLSYAELTSTFSKAGAEYQFVRAAFPKWKLAAFLAGYLIALNAAGTSATVSFAFAGYLSVFVEAPAIPVAFSLLAICTLINIAGIRQSTWVSIGLICIEVAGLLLIIWCGIQSGDMSRSFATPPSMGNAAGIFSATALIFFIYIGFEDIANLSEETHNPERTVPRALLISVLLTSLMYILVALSVIALSTPAELSNSDSPLTKAAENISPRVGQALAVAALFATASTALISLISISRLLFGMAREGDMPSLLAKILPVRETPWVAALALFAAACALLPLGDTKTLASVTSLGVLLVFIGVQLAMIRLRYTQPEAKRTFRVPLAIGRFPILPAIGIAMSLALITQFEPVVYGVGGGALLLGILIYWLQKRKARQNAG